MGRNFKGVWIPADLYLDTNLTWTQKIILIEVDSFSKNNLDCFVSNEHLAGLIGISESGIEKAIRNLVESKKLVRNRTFINGGNRRLLRLPTSLSCGSCPHSSEVRALTQVRHTITSDLNQLPKPIKGRPNNFDEVLDYFKGLGMLLEEAQKFVDWYDSVGWKVKGGNSIKDWKACARQWKRRNKQNTHNGKKGFNTDNFSPEALNDFVNNG
jgi:hypothetical protein